MSKILNVSASPHIKDKDNTTTIMRDVVIALLPTAAFGVIKFGVHALLIIVATVISCVLSEYAIEKILKRPITIKDLSAVVTGMILALNMPPSIPLWMPFLGGIFAIVIVKQMYGGLGQNFMNPALAARCFMLVSFTSAMSSFTLDGISTPTQLSFLKTGSSGMYFLVDCFIGNMPGTIGEVSKIFLLCGGLYLIVRKVISPRIPLIYVATTLLFIAIFGERGFDVDYLLLELCSGGLIFGALFMATDYVTCPFTPMGQVIFAIFIGILTGIFRVFGSASEGVSYAILLGNIVTPLIDKISLPKAFGMGGKK